MVFGTAFPTRARIAGLAASLLPRRIRRDERGSSAVEFAIIALPFFALIGAIMETALVFLASQILESAVNDAARLIRTGQAQQSGTTAAGFKTAICNRLYTLIDCAGVYVDVRTVTSFTTVTTTKPIDADGNFVPTTNYDAGKATQIVVVKAYYEFPLVFSGFGLDLSDLANGKRLIGAVTAFRNEPFPW
jgi:Flp pilus assembly protein TadG